ncbi:hypothetical protein GCM10029964_051670 [Kibdelosporangium lantanae]
MAGERHLDGEHWWNARVPGDDLVRQGQGYVMTAIVDEPGVCAEGDEVLLVTYGRTGDHLTEYARTTGSTRLSGYRNRYRCGDTGEERP